MPSKEILRRSRICVVPACKAVNSDFPDRIFFAVPENKKKEWLGIVGGDTSSIKTKKRLFCCENHFNVQRDIEGYHFYKHFGGRIKLEDHAYPYKNLGDNITVPPPQLPITIAQLPQVKGTDEPCEDSVDPLATSDNENDSDEESNREPNDTDFNRVDSDSTTEETNLDAEQPRSEEIIVTSDVYMQDDDDSDDDVPLKENTEDDSIPDPFVNAKSKKVNSNYNCSKCGKNLSSSRSLKRHLKSFHVQDEKNKKPEAQEEEKSSITCKECNVFFMTRGEYQKHKLSHKRSFECDVCQKVFRTRFRLKVHYVMHVNEKTFLCETCSRPFARASTLRRHRYTHVTETERKFVCDFVSCGKRFPALYLLKLHITQSHTDSATVMCALCSKIFTTNSHKRTSQRCESV